MRVISLAFVACSVLAVGACGSDEKSADKQQTAGQIVKGLSTQIPEVKPSIIYDEASDPNDLLGRPNGYESKAAFTDTRVPKSKTEGVEKGDVELGGGVEVFANSARAERRAQYLDDLQAASPELLGTDYLYVGGSTLLRVSGLLTPEEASEIETALSKILGSTVSRSNKGAG